VSASPTIIVPCYGNAADVRRCLTSVRRHWASGPADARLIVIDDASPGAEVQAVLDEVFAEEPGEVTRLRNEVNAGFAGTVNRGFEESDGDVVLLNTDAVVTDGWLTRLMEAASEGHDIATVTPLTNEGSICTLPPTVIDAFDLRDARARIDECAAFVLEHGLGARPGVITGVGFCMYITRRAIDAVGPLDADTFGPGYGEEVDFCLRARSSGFRHLVEDRTFVYHRGGATFGPAREEAMARASQTLHQRYPGFRRANRREQAIGPLAASFAALELALHPRDPQRTHVLHLLHRPSPYGGTEKHLDALKAALCDRFDFSVLSPTDTGFVLDSQWSTPTGEPASAVFEFGGSPDDAVEALRTVLDGFSVDVVHIQNLIGHSIDVLPALRDFSATVVCSVHDLYLACPNHSLLFLGHESCGIPDDLEACATCLPATRELPVEDLVAFRDVVASSLDVVDRWICPSRSAADYLLRAYPVPEERIAVIPHGSVVEPAPRPPLDEDHVLEAPLTVAFVGRGWTKKGLDVVNELAEAMPDVRFHHFGELRDEAAPHLDAHGPYDNRSLPALLHETGVHVVLIPGPYAETFGFVMTEALLAGLPVIGPRYGAIAERIRRDGVGWTIDPQDLAGVHELIDNLDRARLELLRATLAARRVPIAPVRSTIGRYEAIYEGAAG
jgi:GT2 family glycosyltransferase